MLALDTFAVELAHWFNITWRLGQNATEIRSVTLTSWSEAGSQMVDTEPSFNFSFFANPALYCPSLKKQSVLKWLAQTYTTLGRFRALDLQTENSTTRSYVAGRQTMKSPVLSLTSWNRARVFLPGHCFWHSRSHADKMSDMAQHWELRISASQSIATR